MRETDDSEKAAKIDRECAPNSRAVEWIPAGTSSVLSSKINESEAVNLCQMKRRG